MPDLQKVINGLEWCMCEKHDCYSEKGCPYENEGDDVGCKYALHRDALALLKAQEPVEPVFTAMIKTDMSYWSCGACGAFIFGNAYPNAPMENRPHYCGYCGQAVKWE